MTRTVRAPAQLLKQQNNELLGDGIAVIWGDPAGWGGIFEPAKNSQPGFSGTETFTAWLRTLDGRRGLVTITPSQFVADGSQPLTFVGQGDMDTAQDKAMSDEIGPGREA